MFSLLMCWTVATLRPALDRTIDLEQVPGTGGCGRLPHPR